MKKICICLSLLVGSVAISHSQGIIPIPSDTSVASGTITDEFDPQDIHLEVKNNTVNSQTFSWMLKNYSTPSTNWEVKLCDNKNCYDLLFNPGPYESLNVSAGDTMDFKFQFSPHCVSGTGDADVLVWLTGDSANTALMIHFTANLIANCPNAITDIPHSNLRLYPNPVKGTFTVNGLSDAGNLSFEVYNMKGDLVKSSVNSTVGDQIEISIETLAKGTYILKVADEGGRIVATSRLNKVD